MFKKLCLVSAIIASISYAVYATNNGRSFTIAGIRFPGATPGLSPTPLQEATEEPERVRYNARANAVIAEGRIASYPGATVSVGAEITGTLIEVAVLENEVIHKGQLIAKMRSDDLRASRDLSVAELGEATAEVEYWTRETNRLEALHRKNAFSFADLDSARRSLAVMVARKARALAAINQAEALLAKAQIVAPIDGMVVARSAHAGETLTVGTAIVKMVDLDRLRVEAEVDEYDIGKIATDTICKITAEGFAGQTWTGFVEEIPAEVTPRRIRPEDPSRPADTRVVVVKVSVNGPTPLKIGQRVYVTIQFRQPDPPLDEPAPDPEKRPGSAPPDAEPPTP